MSQNNMSPRFDDLQLECVSIRHETAGAKTYVFAPTSAERIAFSPGQFLNLNFPVHGEENLRSYSISSSAAIDRTVAITVQRVQDGIVSNWLHDHLRVGDRIRASGPSGVFTPETSSRPVLLLTAGSGITPAASMMRSYSDQNSEADVVLLHFARTPEDIIFRDEMPIWARHMQNARIIPIVTRPPRSGGWLGPVGRLSREILAALVPDAASRRVYCCGPETFMSAAQEHLLELGLTENDFVKESFSPISDDHELTPVGGATSYSVEFVKSRRHFAAPENMTVLAAAREAGARIPTSCRNGICGTCRVKVLSGSVDMQHNGGIRPREIEGGFILACCSRPTSDLQVEA